MGEVAMECESHFTSRPMPGIAHSSPCSNENAGKRNRKKHSINRCHYLKSSYGDFKGSGLGKLPDFHCKSMPSGTLEVIFEENVMLKRSSIYLTSSEVRRMRKHRKGRKVESSYNDDALLSFEIVDSLLQSPSEVVHVSQQNRPSLVSLNAEPESSSEGTAERITRRSMEFLDLSFRYLFGKHLKPDNSPQNDLANDLFEICLDSEDIKYPPKNVAPKLLEAGSFKDLKPDCWQNLGVQTDRNIHNERDTVCSLPKSFPAKTGICTSPNESESVHNKVTTKGPFSPLKRMFDPIMRSKSIRSTSLKETEAATVINSIIEGNRVGRLSCKSLLNDFSKTTWNVERNNWLFREHQHLETPASPAHLHAILKVEQNKGIQSFKFSTKDPEDILSAKAWKTENASKWIYTFHSCRNRNNSIGRGFKDRYRHSAPVIGQMQVSCNPSSEVRNKFIAAEFILYDIAQARRSSAVEERTRCSLDFIQPPRCTVAESLVAQGPLERENSMERQHHIRHSLSTWDSNASTCYPWPQADLHPQLESAAIVIQIPLDKKESSEDIKVEQSKSKGSANVSSVTSVNQERQPMASFLYADTLKVVIPSGAHGLPSGDVVSGPLSLLDRWRFGGGCDCGGWDMACPVVVLDNPCDDDCADYLTIDRKKELVLFVQGNKEKIPALSININEKGQYSVDFHAQLSALQAFAISIAILHSSGNSSPINQEVKHKLYSNSLKLLLAEEMNFIEAVAVEEKRNTKKKVEQTFLDLPISPIGRV